MPAVWRIDYWPRCDNHVFLSHSAEDRDSLVIPAYRELEGRRIKGWIDYHDYPLGRDPMEALQEELLKARHVVYFVTASSLQQGRGWIAAERAFATVVQQRLRLNGPEVAHVELPLLFVPSDDQAFLRSIWRPLSDKASRCPYAAASEGASWRDEHVQWAADTIEAFVRQEDRWSLQLVEAFDQDRTWSNHFKNRFKNKNLRERLLAQSPPPLGQF
jgi:hypothetical protein